MPTGVRSVAAARHAAWLFIAWAAVCVAMVALPGQSHRLSLLWLAALLLGAAGVAAALPWRRWRATATLVLTLPAFALIGATSVADVLPPRTYGLFFALVFAWVGVHHPPLTILRVVPIAVPFYVVPLIAFPSHPPFEPRGLALVMVVGVLLAETIARGNRTVAAERARAERAANAFRVVSATNARLRTLDPDEVLAAVVDGALALGYEGANLAIVAADGATFVPVHARGIAAAYAEHPYPVAEGVTGLVISRGAVVIVDDYQTCERAIPEIRAAGIRTCIGVPVFSDGEMRAVLFTADRHRRAVNTEDIEALKILADNAGAALGTVRQFEAERSLTASNMRAATFDDLTGVPNRRYANQQLDRLAPDDVLVMIDLDHFKTVNDAHGHPAGDRLLQDIAGHLARGVRSQDHIARYGGEEFLLILPSTIASDAMAIVERLLQTWREQDPPTTFSAGIATRRSDESPAATLARADAALFDAKRAGRNRCAHETGLGTAGGREHVLVTPQPLGPS